MEPEIQALARQLLAAAQRREPLILSPAWWQEQLLEWATRDPDFRVKLLRFVDVLPALRTSASVADHVRQYFREDAPALIEAGSHLASPPVFRPVVSRFVREGVFAMAHRFIAGESPEQAVPRLRALADDGVGYTVDLLGEATLSEREADTYLERYSALLRTLASEGPGPATGISEGVPPVNVSVKLSALSSHFEPAAPEHVSAALLPRLLPILRLARELGAFVNVDMEQYAYRDLVQRVFADALMQPDLRDFAGAGIVVQAYLRTAEDSIRFLADLAAKRGAPITVRLVKGAYWEEERIVAAQNGWSVPVYEDKAATDASFERCTDLLLASWPHLRAAFGTHNPRSVAQAIVKSRAAGLERQVEFQMLFGMADTLREAVAAEGLRTRVYVPVGAIIPGMAYLVRRLLENTSNQSWFVKESLDVPEDELVAPPMPAVSTGMPTPLPNGVSRSDRSPSPKSERGPGGEVSRAFINTPVSPFHDSNARHDMNLALQRVGASFGATHPLHVGDHAISDRPLAEVRGPGAPSLVIGRVAQATTADVDTAVRVAQSAFEAWSGLGVEQRAAILDRAARLMQEHCYELAALMVYESGKPWREADGDVAEACDYLRYYARQALHLMQPERLGDVPGEENLYLREPRGVAAVIAPWNFPLAIITGMSSAALAAGNCAILKPAEQSPIVAAKLVELLREAGMPPGAVQYLPGPGEVVGRALVEHPDVATIAFTGSKAVGLGIIEAASRVLPGQRQVKRVIAEMGGKNAVIIDDDADLDQAVTGVVASAFGYAGQKCSACSRLIVVGSAYPEVESRLAAAVESLVVGPPDDPATFVPPVISEEAQRRIEGYIDAGKRTARLLVQGRRPDTEGYYVAPTVFADVNPDDRLARDEIFGPVLSVFHVPDMQAALDLALDSEYALTGGLFSRNPRNIALARRAFRVGNLYINRKITGAAVGRQAFGGLGLSGIGDKAGGPDYLLQFLSPRTLTENTMRRGFAPE